MDISMKLIVAAVLAGLLVACTPAAEEAAPADEAVEAAAEDVVSVEEGAAAEAPPGTDIHIYALSWNDGVPSLGAQTGGVTRSGYDNQPWFTPDGLAMLYAADHEGGDTDIWSLDLASGAATNLTNTPVESEYSPRYSPDNTRLTYVHQPEGGYGGQVYAANLDGSDPAAAFEYGPLGYYTFNRAMDLVLIFALSDRGNSLQLVNLRYEEEFAGRLGDNMGRSIYPAINSDGVFYTLIREDGRADVYSKDFESGSGHRAFVLPGQTQDFAVLRTGDRSFDHGFFAIEEDVLYYRTYATEWAQIANLDLTGSTRLAVSYAADRIAIVAED